MRKTLVFLCILFGLTIIISNNIVKGDTSTETTTTQTISTSETIYYEGEYYYYSDYQDLIGQVYEDVYEEVYEEIYNQVMSEIDQEYYDDIYESVEADLTNLLSEDDISVYLAELQQDLYDVISLGENSVFGITNHLLDGSISIGSGVVYKYDSAEKLYYLITNYHVIDDTEELEIRFADESSVEAMVIGYDTEVDIAILSFSSDGLDNIQVSPLGDSDDIEISEPILAIGNPVGYGFYNSVTLGIVSGVDRYANSDRFVGYIQHDSAINGGNSGGPIYNLDGEVIGINVSKLADTEIEGIGFAIPINIVKTIITKIESDNLPYNTIKPRIGFSYYVVEEKLEDEYSVRLDYIVINLIEHHNYVFDLPTGISSGLIVRNVEAYSTTFGVFEAADLIYTVENYQITDESSFLEHLYSNYEAGDNITFYYYEFDEDTDAYNETLQSITLELK